MGSIMEAIKSVGIDIGTSTSKFMISELKLGRISSHFALPHFEIVERRVIYVSDIISTPIKNRDEIDFPPLVAWLEKEYRAAGITLSNVKSGAVIITGETALKKNADALIHVLAERAGDFVVAIAGASLEAVLAGKGSGAYEYSLQSKGIIANIDIGGGTANVVLFENGEVLETITFHIGGRLIEVNQEGEILSVSPSLRQWLFYRNYQVEVGAIFTFSELKNIASALCWDLLDILQGKKWIESLVHSSSSRKLPKIDVVTISGGVGKLLQNAGPESLVEAAVYQDIGPLLAMELSKAFSCYPFKVVDAVQTSRATVIGAGMQATKLSGATISVKKDLLPLRNIPVVKITFSNQDFEQGLEEAFLKGKDLFGENKKLPFAIGLGSLPYLSYSDLKKLSSVISCLYDKHFPYSKIMVVVCENDMAKALGQVLSLQTNFAVICIDQVVIDNGDYIDIGEPLQDTMVPVVVKTLAFHK